MFLEHIKYGLAGCVTGGTVNLTKLEKNKMQYDYNSDYLIDTKTFPYDTGSWSSPPHTDIESAPGYKSWSFAL